MLSRFFNTVAVFQLLVLAPASFAEDFDSGFIDQESDDSAQCGEVEQGELEIVVDAGAVFASGLWPPAWVARLLKIKGAEGLGGLAAKGRSSGIDKDGFARLVEGIKSKIEDLSKPEEIFENAAKGDRASTGITRAVLKGLWARLDGVHGNLPVPQAYHEYWHIHVYQLLKEPVGVCKYVKWTFWLDKDGIFHFRGTITTTL